MHKALFAPAVLSLTLGMSIVSKPAEASPELRVEGKYFKDARAG